MSAHSVEIREIKQIEKGRYKAILGFAGAGFIGNTAAMFVTRSKSYPQVAWVKSNYIPPMILITNGSPIQSFRVHLDQVEKILFVITESLIPAEGCWPIAEALMKWLVAKGVQEIYSIDGLPFSAVPPDVKALTYSSKIDLSTTGYPALKEGALSGINSCVLEECSEKGYPYACIFVPTNKLTTVDYSGVADAIDVMNRLFKLGADASPLRGSSDAQVKAVEKKQLGIGKILKKG